MSRFPVVSGIYQQQPVDPIFFPGSDETPKEYKVFLLFIWETGIRKGDFIKAVSTVETDN